MTESQSQLFDFSAGTYTRSESLLDTIRAKCKEMTVHDFAYSVMYTYKDLPKLISKGAVRVTDEGISLTPTVRNRDFYFFQHPAQSRLLQARHDGFRCMLIDKVEGLSGFVKRNETIYNLENVFNPSSYSNAKKRRQRIKYPFTFLDRENIQVSSLLPSELPEAIVLHDAWVATKMADEKVHRISFPIARYRRCTQYAFHDSEVFKTYKARDDNGKLIAVRVIGYEDHRAFDLAYYSDFQNMKSQLTEYLNVAFMKEMLDDGIVTLNAGLSSEKGLKQFKNHLPNETLISYQWK